MLMPDPEPAPGRTDNKVPRRAPETEEREDKPVTRAPVERSSLNGNWNGGATVTQAQCRALYALTKKARYTDQDIESLLRPLNASTFQELTRESASQLITYLQTEVAA